MHRMVFILLILLTLPMGMANAAPDGKRLFAQNCEACHGENGKGGVGVPLSLGSFIDSVPDEYLKKTIRLGRPGRVMPSFASLSDAQVNALVKYIRSWGHKPAPRENMTPIKGDAIHGAKVFQQNCAACHGANGGGGKGTGVTFSRPRDLPIIAPALHNLGFLGAVSDQMIRDTLVNGRKGTPMISFLKQGLSEKDINDVVAYVRSFEKSSELKKAATDEEKEGAVFSYDSPYTFDETVKAVKKAVVGANFRLIRTQLFEQGYVKKGTENPKKVIIYFCNFNMLNEALAIDPRAGLFLPCRITVVENKGKVKVIAINPSTLSHSFNNNELDLICKRMNETYKSILEESVL